MPVTLVIGLLYTKIWPGVGMIFRAGASLRTLACVHVTTVVGVLR